MNVGTKDASHVNDDIGSKKGPSGSVERLRARPEVLAAPDRPDSPGGADLAVAGVLRVRLIGGTREDRERVSAQCGLPLERCAADAAPDFTVRFARALAPTSLTYVGLNFAAFSDEHFYVLHHKTGEAAVRLPFDVLGGDFEIVCQSGLPSVPLLNDLLALHAQLKGFVALHASAFSYRGSGVLVTGWAKGGKTEALLAFANHGAIYVGDECILLSPSGESMFGLPMPVTVADWMVPQVAGGRARASLARRLVFAGVRALDAAHRCGGRARRMFRSNVRSLSVLARALPVLKQAARFQIAPARLFLRAASGVGSRADVIFLMLGHSRPDVSVERVEADEVAARMRHSHVFEQQHLMQYYQAFRFAFPALESPALERLAHSQSEQLAAVMAGRRAYKVVHPYPVTLERLFEAMRPYCEAPDGDAGFAQQGSRPADRHEAAAAPDGSRGRR